MKLIQIISYFTPEIIKFQLNIHTLYIKLFFNTLSRLVILFFFNSENEVPMPNFTIKINMYLSLKHKHTVKVSPASIFAKLITHFKDRVSIEKKRTKQCCFPFLSVWTSTREREKEHCFTNKRKVLEEKGSFLLLRKISP